ncbi:hypothetical protein JX265_006455 [Neoarthrinium moseri]|uniref:AA1-like domain-containing protein n=1 Tax=Neoarthrinium moseri TaxID=1658444 RepID=A0A9P9WLF6_9PEZI|nr:hypothetical protein JX266_000267 [Neoarthrinium moseri]KAI1869365.1 hypothetical protein JX265_006455 [Neoarthrinium moseri]
MKFSAIATSYLISLAAAAPQGIEKDATWTLSDVSANSTPGFNGALTTSYSLTITTDVSHQTAHCQAESHETGAPLGALPKTKCDPDVFAFSWTPKGQGASDGYTLEVYDATTKQHATHDIPADQIKDRPFVINDVHPHYYAGPSQFKVKTQLD